MTLSMIGAFIKWRSVYSFEGVGMSVMAFTIVSDAVPLILALIQDDDLSIEEVMGDRVLPNVVLCLGLVALSFGLWLTDRRGSSVPRVLTPSERSKLRRVAPSLVVLGLGMKATALYTSGISSLGSYLTNLGTYNIGQRSIGGFLDLGTGIALFGFALLIAAFIQWRTVATCLIFAMASVSFLLSTSKADLVGVVMLVAYVGAIFAPQEIRALARRRAVIVGIVPVLVLALVVNAGFKAQFRGLSGQADQLDFSADSLFGWGLATFQGRFGSQGLYDGYSNLVNRLTSGEYPFFEGRVLHYAAVTWVPYFLSPEKPPHPFRNVGVLMYSDYHTTADEVTAPGLFGTGYADFGFASLFPYLAVYGAIIGSLRRVLTRPGGSVLGVAGYTSIAMIDGSTNVIHGGLLNLPGNLLVSGAVLLTMLVYSKLLDVLALKQTRAAGIGARWDESQARVAAARTGAVGRPSTLEARARVG